MGEFLFDGVFDEFLAGTVAGFRGGLFGALGQGLFDFDGGLHRVNIPICRSCLVLAGGRRARERDGRSSTTDPGGGFFAAEETPGTSAGLMQWSAIQGSLLFSRTELDAPPTPVCQRPSVASGVADDQSGRGGVGVGEDFDDLRVVLRIAQS